MSGDDHEGLFVRLPPSLKYLVDEDERTNKEVVITALERELGVGSDDSTAVIERKIRRTEQHLQEQQEAARERVERVGDLKDKLTRLRELHEQRADDEGSYADALDAVLDELVAGDINHLGAYHPRLDSIRKEFDRSNDEIHWDLRDRAADQERDLQNTRFMDLNRAKQKRRHDEERPIAEAWEDDG